MAGRTPETATVEFYTAGPRGRYARIQPDNRPMLGFEVPVGGTTIAGQAYVLCKIEHTQGAFTDRTLVTRFDPIRMRMPARSACSRTISQIRMRDSRLPSDDSSAHAGTPPARAAKSRRGWH